MTEEANTERDMEREVFLADVKQLVDDIVPRMRKEEPNVIGAVVADLTARWVAGHRPDLRDAALKANDELVRDLIADYAQRGPWAQ